MVTKITSPVKSSILLIFAAHLVPHYRISLQYLIAFALQLLIKDVGVGFAEVTNFNQ